MSSSLSLALNNQMSTDCDTLNPLPYRHRFKKALVPPIESHLRVCSSAVVVTTAEVDRTIHCNGSGQGQTMGFTFSKKPIEHKHPEAGEIRSRSERKKPNWVKALEKVLRKKMEAKSGVTEH